MLTIYAIPVSLYCAKLRILLRHKNLQWQEVPPPGGYGSNEYKQIVASGNLPAMEHDGLLLADSEAIAEYLNEKHPDPQMLPGSAEERARIRELSRFHDTRLEPELRKLFPHIAASARDGAVVAAQSAAIAERLTQLSRMLEMRGQNHADTLTLGDCGYPITFTWIDLLAPVFGFSIQWPRSVVDYRQKIAQIPAVSEELAAYRPALDDWLAGEVAA